MAYLSPPKIGKHMKKFFSTRYSDSSFNVATLLLRLTFGLLLIFLHGIDKITHFSSLESTFFDFMHLGHRISLLLCMFAEIFCAGLVVLGLLTRLAALVVVINFSVVVFMVLKGRPLAGHEAALTYLVAFFALLLTGPGRISIDGAMGK
jgi:putative oxidoreductase